MKKLSDSPHLFAFITVLCWAPSYVFNRTLAPFLSPESLGFLRFGIAAVILSAILIRKKLPFPEPRDLPRFAAAALCGFSLYMIIFNKGTGMLTAATSSVIIAISPVLTTVLASVIFHERLKPVLWLFIGLEFAGIVILTDVRQGFSVNQGILWMLLCVLMFSCFNLFQRKLTETYTPLQTSGICIIFGALELIWAAPTAVREFAALPVLLKSYVLFLGLFSSALAYITWAKAFAKAKKTSDVVNYMFLTPFLAALLDFILNREIPKPTVLIGGLMILTGAILFNITGSRDTQK